jgi:hypothetical protein
MFYTKRLKGKQTYVILGKIVCEHHKVDYLRSQNSKTSLGMMSEQAAYKIGAFSSVIKLCKY